MAYDWLEVGGLQEGRGSLVGFWPCRRRTGKCAASMCGGEKSEEKVPLQEALQPASNAPDTEGDQRDQQAQMGNCGGRMLSAALSSQGSEGRG